MDISREAHRMLLASDFLTFAKKMFYAQTKNEYIVGEHHKLICEALMDVVKGKTNRLIINIAPRFGKCVCPQTRIMTSRGLLEAKDVLPSDLLYSYDNGRLVLEPCLATEKAHKDCVKVTMRSGRSLVCSSDHPLLTTFGYIEAGQLKYGDRVKVVNSIVDTPYEIDDDELTFVTLMIFDGCCRNEPRFTKKDATVIALMKGVCDRLGLEMRHRYNINGCDYAILSHGTSKARDLMKKYGVYGHLAYDKRIPRDWFSLSKRQKLLFIDLMFATDGYAQRNGTSGIALANRGLIDDIQHILSTLGIISSIYYKPNDKHGAYVLCIPRRETQKLLSMITFYQKRCMAKRALEKNAVCITDTFPYEIIRKEKLTYKTQNAPFRCSCSKDITREKFIRLSESIPQLKKYIDKDFYLDKVMSVEHVGVMDLIHLEVNRTHNFIANGMVSHNTELVSRLFPAFCFALNPMCRFLHLSYSWGLVTGNSVAIKQYIANPYFKYCFEAATQYKMDARDHWHTVQGGEFYATSTLGQITGFGAGRLESENIEKDAFGERFNPNNFNGAIIIDDPIRPEDALSDAVRETVNRRFETTIRNRVNSRNTPIIIIMQRLHEHDLCGYLNEVEPDVWKTLSLPAIIYDEEGNEQSLWPFKFTLEELHHLREVNPIVYETQYMQNPKPWEGLMYRDFGTYDIIPFSKKNKRVNYTDSADTGADWLCSVCYVEAPDACYVTDVLFTKKPMEYTEPAMAKMIIDNATEKAYVESNNGGRGFMRNVKRLCGEMGYNKCYFHGFTQTKNKQVRIFTKANEANNLILFPSDWERRWPQFAQHIKSYRKEGSNAHDDGPDVLSGIVEFHGRQNGMSDTEIMKYALGR